MVALHDYSFRVLLTVVSMLSVFRALLLKKYPLSATAVIVISVCYLILFNNYAFWSSLFNVIDPSAPKMWLFLFSTFAVIFAVCFIFFSIFGVSRVLKPLIISVFILAACTSYYMDAYGTVFDDGMILNILETTIHESYELLDLKFILHVLLFGILPSLILLRIDIIREPFFNAIKIRLVALVVVISVSSSVVFLSYKDMSFIFRENREVSFFINPVYPIRAVYRFVAKRIQNSNREFLAVFQDARRTISATTTGNEKPDVLILVVGETARAQNFHLNGYARNTTPNLSEMDVINFSDVSSCGTATAISVPCMFSDMDKNNFNHSVRDRQNLLDALNIAGLDVLWLENNPDCKGVCDRIPTKQMSSFYTDELCKDGQCFDAALLKGLDDFVDTIKNDAVIVLHTQGSHGPAYYKRYPEEYKQFLPECRRSAVQECTDEEVLNAYDNTIIYTDYFLSKVIEHLSEKTDSLNTAMLYVSDHGESLGENGVYLHGLPYFVAPEYQTKVPMILWMSAGFLSAKSINQSCLRNESTNKLSHDNYLHSIMGVMDVTANLYNPGLDIFSSCRKTINMVEVLVDKVTD